MDQNSHCKRINFEAKSVTFNPANQPQTPTVPELSIQSPQASSSEDHVSNPGTPVTPSDMVIVPPATNLSDEEMEENIEHPEMTLDKTVKYVPTFSNQMTGPGHRSVYFGGFSSLTSSEEIRALAGISENVFALLLSLFPNSVPQYYELKLEDKLLLTLFKIKSGLSFKTIATIFGVPAPLASRIFYAFISHLKAVTYDWIFLPTQHAVQQTLPDSFKENFSKCRLIIDCTEFRTEKPPTVEQRVQMYSSYKSGYTAKYLIGITPAGLISFVSPGYGGRATDSFITNDCGILNLLEDGDIVLADKGFPHVSVKDNTVLVMPPFAKRNQQQFPENDMQRTYEIASVRIHVERSIQRIKMFDIMTKIIPTEMLSRFDDILHVVCVLVNLSNPIIRGDHNLF